MIKYFILILHFISGLTVMAQSVTRKVLFLGNSYTSVNNLPLTISNFASSMNDSLIFDSNAPGGYTLEDHVYDSTSINKILSATWDYVVMQEQSQLPSFVGYYSSGPRNLSRSINKSSPCARVMFYMTWGRENGDAGNCAVWPPVCTYLGMDSLLNLRYREMAMREHAELSPVGAVWKYIRQNNPSIQLYQADESHPSEAGTFLAAACFYTSLFKKDPTASQYNSSLAPADAAAIRNAAKTIIFDSLQNWNYILPEPVPEFNFTIGTGINEVLLNNISENADYFEWNFGDGNLSTDTNTTHNYSADGLYQIELKASKCDLDSMYDSNFSLSVNFCSHTPTITPDTLFLCPLNADTLWTEPADAYQWIDANQLPIPGEINQYIVAAASYTPYAVIATQNNCTEISHQAFVEIYNFGLVIYNVYSSNDSINPDSLCEGDTIALYLSPNKPDTDYKKIQWFKDGQVIPSGIYDTLLVTTTGNYSVNLSRSLCPDYSFFQSLDFSYTFLDCNIGVNDINAQSEINIYPNPSNEKIVIEIDPAIHTILFSLCDISGREIYFGKLNGGINNIDLSNYSKGVYFLKFNSLFAPVKLLKN